MSLKLSKAASQQENAVPTSRGHEPSASDSRRPVDYAAMAFQLLKATRNDETLNRLGVCYLRLGKADEAVKVYRQIALQAGGVCERTGLSELYARNFATALLLAGLPSGCLLVLRGLADQRHERVVALYAAVRAWEKSLPFLRRWDWRLNSVDPPNARVPIDFEPGEMD